MGRPPAGRLRAGLLLAGAAATAAYLMNFALSKPRPVQGPDPTDGFTRIAGVVHIHTTLSDGGGDPEEVIRAARAAGLRFVIITDHNNSDARSFEGYHDGVLVLVGTEISTTKGHILGVGIREPTFRYSGDGLDALDDIRQLGGFAIAAHPFSPRADLRFTGWDLPGDFGMELMNGDSEWRGAGVRSLGTALLYGVNPRRALLSLLSSPRVALARWDRELALRDVAGFVGTDAHSRLLITRNFALRFPSYESLFSLLQNHVLLREPLSGDFEKDRLSVLEALRAGRLYIGLDGYAPAGGFSFIARVGKDVAPASGLRTATLGESLPFSTGIRLVGTIRGPTGFNARLLRDGSPLAVFAEGFEIEAPGPGVYRLEVEAPGAPTPWIISNPIYLLDEARGKSRTARSAWPSPTPLPSPERPIDGFGAGTAFSPGFDGSSTLAQVPDQDAVGKRDSATRLDFHVGRESPDHPSPFVATVDRTRRDFGGARGIAVSVRADGEYRMFVQVRDENPASKDEGTEWWFASIRTSTEWTRVAIPFDRMRSINPVSDGRLDLDRVRAIVFVMDRGAIRPGTRGQIWLDNLALY